MEKIIDMHTHTSFSDGDKTPDALIKYAKEHNIGTMAITDHDTLQGVQDLDRSILSDIEFYDGIELTAKISRGRMHILGYGINIHDLNLNSKIEEIKSNDLYTMISYFNDLRINYGISFPIEDIRRILNANRNIGRPDIAKLLVKYGYFENINDAFDYCLTDMHDRMNEHKVGIKPDECLSLIKNAGGLAILAHPHTLLLDDDTLVRQIKRLIDYGLDGIEVYHSNHSIEQMKKYKLIAEKLNLLISGGSDYHGMSVKPDIEIGTGRRNNIYIKELSLVKKLQDKSK